MVKGNHKTILLEPIKNILYLYKLHKYEKNIKIYLLLVTDFTNR
jgi:hypothetical protein